MQYRSRLVLIFTLLIAAGVFACRDNDTPDTQVDGSDGQILTVTELAVGDFRPESGRGMEMMAGGITIEEDALSAEFTTDVISSTHPFNYVVPEWTADIPQGAAINVQLRTAPASGQWTQWQIVTLDPDISIAEENIYAGGYADSGDALAFSERVQLRFTLRPNNNDEKPVVSKLTISFIDSTNGPTTQEIIDTLPNEGLDSDISGAQGHPKPRVISRQQWCTHADCSYSNGLAYYPVSHLIVHHTVSNNATTDWAANVRAIWTFHTFTRGWGDVGYNYLIDPNGNIYEGHIGGDNVIGTHAAAANRGGMGIALLGTFSTHDVPEPMKAALVELLAWKADQRNIDLWDASRLPLLDWGNLHLMGHRDAFGETACPGDHAHNDLAEIRRRVDNKLGRTEDYAYVDDRDGGFSTSNANWRDGPKQCGFNSHSFYTFTTSDSNQSSNVAEWRPNIASSGTYQVDAYVPFCKTGQSDATQATYKVTGADGTRTVVRSQENNIGMWVNIGRFNFNQGTGNVIQLSDLTNSENGTPIWFDAIRYKPTDGSTPPPPPAADTTPPTSRITQVFKKCDGDFALTWEGSDNDSGVKHYDIAYKRPGTNSWVTVLNDTKLNTFTFTPPDQNNGYRFRAQATDNSGNNEAPKANGDIGDGAAIPCNIQPPDLAGPIGENWIKDRRINFRWNIAQPEAVKEYTIVAATDENMRNVVLNRTINGSQLELEHNFDRDYSRLYWTVTAKTHFDKLAASGVKSFRLDASPPDTEVHDIYQLANGDYQVYWRGSDQASGITDYTIEYLSSGSSNWQALKENTTQKTAVFRPPNPSATYVFRSRGRDVAGNREGGPPSGDFNTTQACPYISVPPAHVSPEPDSWRTNRAITFRWAAPQQRCITSSLIEVSRNKAFGLIVHTKRFDDSRGSHVYTAESDVQELWWRATYTTVLGESFTSEPTRLQFDAAPPVSQIVEVLRTPVAPFAYIVRASGSDSQSGLAGYIFEYRREGDSRWVRWAVSDGNSATFVPPTDDLYWFRSLAIDGGGNIEPADSNGDLSSADSSPTSNTFMPIIGSQ